MRIASIAPHIRTRNEDAELVEKAKFASEGTHVEFSYLTSGPKLVENEVHAAEAAWPLVRRVLEVEEDGFDAVIVDCFLDPGVDACRAIAGIPVIGPGRASMIAALQFAQRIGVLNPNDLGRQMVWSNVRRYGIESRIAFVDGLLEEDLRVQENTDEALAALRKRYDEISRTKCCDALILGCTAFETLLEALPPRRSRDIPVILPYRHAIWTAERAVLDQLY